MDFKEVIEFINNTRKILYSFTDNFIDSYIISDFEPPIFLNINYDYDFLQNTHLKITKYLFEIKHAIIHYDNNECEEIINQLLSLKLTFDSLIKNHKSYTMGKFQKNYGNLLSDFKGEDNFIPIHQEIKSKKSIFIKLIYELIKNEKRVDNSVTQRKAFISLFFSTKLEEPIKWNHHIYDLKRFFDLLMENEFIEQPMYFNEFIIKNFLILNKQERFQYFTIKSFQTSKEKRGYNDTNQYYHWDNKLKNIKSRLR